VVKGRGRGGEGEAKDEGKGEERKRGAKPPNISAWNRPCSLL